MPANGCHFNKTISLFEDSNGGRAYYGNCAGFTIEEAKSVITRFGADEINISAMTYVSGIVDWTAKDCKKYNRRLEKMIEGTGYYVVKMISPKEVGSQILEGKISRK